MIKRIVEEKDANLCDALLTKLIRDEKQYNKYINTEFEVNNYFRNMLLNTNNILLGYYYDNNIIGYVFFKQVNDDNHLGYLIDGLYVEENYRNQKIGTKLLKEGLKLVNETNPEFIEVNVMFKNEVAKQLYKSLGFNEYSMNMRKYNEV